MTGQRPGTIRLDVFHQGKTWTTNDGREYRIEDMTRQHRRNVGEFLLRNAWRFAPTTTMVVDGNAVDDGMDAAAAWMRKTVLWQALTVADLADPPTDVVRADPWANTKIGA